MFGTVLTVTVTLMHAYVFLRAASVSLITRHVSRPVIFAAALLLWLLFCFGRLFRHDASGLLASALEFWTMSWMVVVFLTTICLLPVDILTVFGLLFPRHAAMLRGCALAAGAALSIIAFIQGLRPPVVVDYEVAMKGLPVELDGTVIVGMSDLHLGEHLGARWLEGRAAQIRGLKPDLIVLLGDIFETDGERAAGYLKAFRTLSAPMGLWAVLGNHEFYGRRDLSVSMLEQSGFVVLRDEWAEVRPGLVLAGVEDLTASRRGRGRQNVDHVAAALSNRPPGATILFSHTPWRAEQAAAGGAGLMLSGHTHGGQVWPFGYVVKRRYPLLAGRYEVDGMTVIVSRGAGTWGPRMRLWRPGEILRVTLRSASAADTPAAE
ncbi:metallophosphoesterase [bacterium]|nr:metallophosphoesterase [bacterium]